MNAKSGPSASLAGGRHGRRGNAQRQPRTPPPQQPASGAPSAAHRIPIDVLIQILTQHATLSPSCAVTALLVSKAMAPSIEQGALRCVSLFSVQAMESFHRLLKQKPDRGRRVNALWIAPGRQESDLITTLAPPASNGALEAKQRKVQALAREILRGCRRLQHLALDGGFLTPQSAVAFGTPCKPTTLLCVNPHSFLGHFSAPLFRTTVRRLEVVDTTLAVEEVDEIRQMLALRHFVWTSPRANADVMRDVSVLLRILAPRARNLVAVANAEAGEAMRTAVARPQTVADGPDDRRLLDVLANTGTAPPDKARRNQHLQSICTATSQARAAALAATFKKVVEDVEVGSSGDSDEQRPTNGVDESDDEDEDVRRAIRSIKPGSLYVDSARANSSSLHKPSGVELQTRALSSLMNALTVATRHRARRQQRHSSADEDDEDDSGDDDDDDDEDDDDDVVDEWEALRDVVCQRRTANAGSSSRFFAGLGSGPTVVNNGGVIRSTAGSGVSTPSHGWGVSRAASPALRGGGGGTSSGGASGAQTPARYDDEVIDGGRALQRVWRRWRAQVGSGELDRFAAA